MFKLFEKEFKKSFNKKANAFAKQAGKKAWNMLEKELLNSNEKKKK